MSNVFIPPLWLMAAIFFAIALVIELPILAFFPAFRKKRALLSAVFANVVSIVVIAFFVRTISSLSSELFYIILTVLLVVVLELLVVFLLAGLKLKKIIIPIIIANLLSSILGSYILVRILRLFW
ncbi:MAG TPA: hypothetical protein VFD45_00635 [Patescibacteria group bacterium]|nr:hypothetical protein [Patescibacteria group bacterium]